MEIAPKFTILSEKTIVKKRGPRLHGAPVGPLEAQTGMLAGGQRSVI